MSKFDTIFTADQLEYQVSQTLQSWFPVYIREVELQTNVPTDALPLPRSYLTSDQIDREAANQLPSIVVVSPGLVGRTPPQQEGDGSFNAAFSIAVGIFVSADRRSSTLRLVRLYTAIVRAIMLQQQGLGGMGAGSYWLDESYDDHFPFVDDQTISAGQVLFEIWVANVVNRYAGPEPPPDPVKQPGSDWGKAETVTPTVVLKE